MKDSAHYLVDCCSLSAINDSPIGVIVCDASGLFTDSNKAFTTLIGRAGQSLIGHTLDELSHPEDILIGVEGMARVLDGASHSAFFARRLVTRDRNVVFVEIYVTQLRRCNKPGDSDTGLLLQILDKTGETHAAKIAASGQDKLRQFASVAAHQLRAPQRTILGLVEAIKEDAADRLIDEDVRMLDAILMKVAQLSEVVEAVHGISTIRSHDVTLGDVDLGEVLLEAWSVVQENRKGKVLVHAGLGYVKGHAPMLTQVLSNIIDNSLKFNTAEVPTVNVTTTANYPFVELCLSDNGIGMPDYAVDRYFEIFYRAHPSYTGTGVGGYIVKAMTEAMCGQASLTSTPGEGTRVTITLLMASRGDEDNGGFDSWEYDNWRHRE